MFSASWQNEIWCIKRSTNWVIDLDQKMKIISIKQTMHSFLSFSLSFLSSSWSVWTYSPVNLSNVLTFFSFLALSCLLSRLYKIFFQISSKQLTCIAAGNQVFFHLNPLCSQKLLSQWSHLPSICSQNKQSHRVWKAQNYLKARQYIHLGII